MSNQDEFYKKFSSKYWRMNNLYHIIDKNNKDIVFQFNDEQQQIWDECFKNDILIKDPNILKARQLGITTFFVLCYLDDVLWEENITAFIQSHDQKSIEKIFRTVAYAYKKFKAMFPEICPNLDRGGGSKFEYYFPDHNSRIYVGLENRSSAVHRLHLSETAFQDKTKIGATTSAVPPHIRYSSETTPNGMNWYFDDWQEKIGAYRHNFFFPWFKRPEYSISDIDTGPITPGEKEYIARIKKTTGFKLSKEQIEFRRMKIQQLKSSSMFDQEFPNDEHTCFMMSSRSMFDTDNLKLVMANAVTEPEYINDFKILIPYNKEDQYSCGVDTSEGVGGDNSVVTIFNQRREQCAIMATNKLKPKQFANAVYQLCEIYGGCKGYWPLLGVERNNHGHAVLLELKDYLCYPNLYYYSDDEDRPGWLTDKVTRPIMIDVFVDGIDNGTAKIYDEDTIKECITFINNNGKPEAEEGKKDDRVIACSIALQMVIENIGSDIYNDIGKNFLI